MALINIDTMEQPLVSLVNNYLDDTDLYFYEGEYIKTIFSVYTKTKLKMIRDMFKFKKVGNASDYPELFPDTDTLTESDAYTDYDKINRIVISNKYRAAMIYTVQRYSIRIFCIIDKRCYKKFNKKLSEILNNYEDSGLFTNFDFKCKKKEYIEISDVKNEEEKGVSIKKKKIDKEHLVFVKNSEIYNVMNDITLFFDKDTKALYSKMHLSYKRGVILYGNPGNGKSAMIREIIRNLSGVSIINISPNTQKVPFIISELISSLHNNPALIIIEDIDAVLDMYNRSEFLNILDGIDMRSGIYFIGTTNYPERIDPAFVNRSGRFDRMFNIGNPNQDIRYEFFKNSMIDEVLKGYKLYKNDSQNTGKSIIDLFVIYSDDLSMANLKELMISTKYMLVSNRKMSIEDALEKVYTNLKTTKNNHVESFNTNRRIHNDRHYKEDY